MVIKYKDPRRRNIVFLSGFQRLGQQLRLNNHCSHLSNLEGVRELVRSMRGIGAGKNTTKGQDAKEGHGIVYLYITVRQAYTTALDMPKATRVEALERDER